MSTPDPLTSEQQTELDYARQVANARKLRDAFLGLFGPPEKRTPLGAIALEYLERFTSYRKPISTLDNTGQTDVHRYFTAIGRQQVMQAIHSAIEWKESEHVNPRNPSST